MEMVPAKAGGLSSRCIRPGGNQSTSAYRNGLPAEENALAGYADTNDAAAGRGLIRQHFGFAKALAPERAEDTVRRSGDGVLINAGAGRKETRNKVETRIIRYAGYDDTPHGYAVELCKIGLQGTKFWRGFDKHQTVKL